MANPPSSEAMLNMLERADGFLNPVPTGEGIKELLNIMREHAENSGGLSPSDPMMQFLDGLEGFSNPPSGAEGVLKMHLDAMKRAAKIMKDNENEGNKGKPE